jgi:hypothetical protein
VAWEGRSVGDGGAGTTTSAAVAPAVTGDRPGFLILRWQGPARAPQIRTTRIVLYAALMVAAFTRAPYLLLHGRFYAEEGSLHFPHMVEHPGLKSLLYVQTRTGYWNFFCDVATWVAAKAPLARRS